MAMDELRTVSETAAMLRLSRSLVYRYVMTGQLASCVFGRRRLVPTSAIRLFIEQHTTGSMASDAK
jgi:excisionase family DNA binding protein